MGYPENVAMLISSTREAFLYLKKSTIMVRGKWYRSFWAVKESVMETLDERRAYANLSFSIKVNFGILTRILFGEEGSPSFKNRAKNVKVGKFKDFLIYTALRKKWIILVGRGSQWILKCETQNYPAKLDSFVKWDDRYLADLV